MNCYDCKFRGPVAGSGHSCCNIVPVHQQFQLYLAYLQGKQLMVIRKPGEDPIPALKLDPHGVKKGWAMWPINFDPVWVSECQFFTSKPNKDARSIIQTSQNG